MPRGPILVLLLALPVSPARAQPIEGVPPEARLEEVAGAIRPTLRRTGTSTGRAVRVMVQVEDCTSVMVAVEPPESVVRLRFGNERGERTGEGIWEVQACPRANASSRRVGRRPVVLDVPAGTRWALRAFPTPGLLGMLSAIPAPSPSDPLAEMAAQMPRYRAGVRMADVSTEGPLTKAQAWRVLSFLRGVIDCWRDRVETDPSLAGDRAVLFIVAPSGEVLAVTVSSPTDGPVGVRASECTTERLRRVRFQATEAGSTSRVRAVLRVTAEPISGPPY